MNKSSSTSAGIEVTVASVRFGGLEAVRDRTGGGENEGMGGFERRALRRGWVLGRGFEGMDGDGGEGLVDFRGLVSRS